MQIKIVLIRKVYNYKSYKNGCVMLRSVARFLHKPSQFSNIKQIILTISFVIGY